MRVVPLGSDPRLARTPPVATGGVLLGELERGGELGWVLRLASGRYVHLMPHGSIRSLDQRKVAAALAGMGAV